MTGDRSQPGGYDGLPDQSWDLVVDVSSQPGYVRSAVRALADRARRWVYVSSLSVYRDNSEPGADESADVLPALDSDQATIEQYGEGKVACEEALRSALPDRSLRGPARTGSADTATGATGSVTGRGASTARPDAPVLVPGPLDAPVQLSTSPTWPSGSSTRACPAPPGTFNAIGEVRRFGDVVAACQAATGHRGEVIVADPDWLHRSGCHAVDGTAVAAGVDARPGLRGVLHPQPGRRRGARARLTPTWTAWPAARWPGSAPATRPGHGARASPTTEQQELLARL